MPDEPTRPPDQPSPPEGPPAAEPKPKAAGDKPPSTTAAEPLKGEVSRTDAPGAGVSATAPAAPKAGPPAPKPENPAAAATATTAEASSVSGAPTPEADAGVRPGAAPAAKPAAPPAEAAPKPAAKAAAPKAPPAPPPPPSGPPDPPPPADAAAPAFVAALPAHLLDAVEQVSYWVGDWTLIVKCDRLLDVARHLRDSPEARFDFCSDVTAVDWPPREKRFDVIYCLYSTQHRHRVRLKVRAAEGDPVPSVTVLWPAANWLEREVYDLFGVNFVGHPDRRRILMPDEWQGHPQRKDYPLEGPGELLMENPLDWLKLRNARDEAEIE